MRILVPFFDTVKSTPHSQKLVQMYQVPKLRSKEMHFCRPYHSNADVQALQLGLFLLGSLLLLLLCLDSFVCLCNTIETTFFVGEKVFLKILKPPPQSPLWVLHSRCHYPFWKKANVFTFTFLATKRQLQRVRSE